MRTFELNIFIDRPREEVYDHISQPINMIGLQPRLTSIDVLKEQRTTEGVMLRPYYTMQTFHWLGLPIFRSRVYSVIHLTQPPSELEMHVFATTGIHIVYRYLFRETEEGNTQLTQKVRFERMSKLLENLVFKQAIQTQRALLANLKVRLEKS